MYKSIKVVGLVVLMLVSATLRGANDPPCKYPPFLGKSAVIPPHIITVIDYSGSMSWLPNGFPSSYNTNYAYSGQFETDKYYVYDNSNGYFRPVGDWQPGDPDVISRRKWIRGNILNMSVYIIRTTILKLVMQGDDDYIVSGPDANGDVIVNIIKRNVSTAYYWREGRSRYRIVINYRYGTFRRDGYEYNPYIGGQVRIRKQRRERRNGRWRWINKETWVNYQPARLKKNYLDTRGVFADVQDKDVDGIVDPDAPTWSIITYQSGSSALRRRKTRDITSLKDALNETYASGGTPTRYGVQRAISVIRNNTQNPSTDIFYEYVNGIAMGLWCKRIYTLVMTDGDWNTGGDPLPYVYNSRRYDQRGDLQNMQYLNYFTMYTFGSGGGRSSQEWIALYGGFKDVDGNGRPGSYSSSLPNSHNSFSCHTASIDREEWDNDADCLPDQFYEVYTAKAMKDAFSAIMEKIKVGVASASAAPSTPVTSKGTGMMFQAVFMPTMKDSASGEERFWLGEIRELFIDPKGNIREDSNNDGKLDLRDDKVITYYFDPNEQIVKVATYEDLNGNGVIDSSELSTMATKSVFRVNSLWNASSWLNNIPASSRRIFYLDNNANLRPFTTSESSTLSQYFGMSSQRSDSLINYIRGTDYQGIYRQRSINGVVWKLGDIIHSTPTYLSTPMERYDVLYGDETYRDYYQQYKDKRGVLFVGANDGMLHCFDAGVFNVLDNGTTIGEVDNNYHAYNLGEEMWGIIPHDLLAHLKWYWREDYDVCHVYYVDGKPKLTDLRIFAPDRVHPQGWGTVLSVGFNFGGDTITAGGELLRSAYLVLDVTDPTDPQPMMEFTDPGLGFTTGYPAFARVDSTWFMLVGSGPDKLSGESDQPATFYVVRDDGSTYRFTGFDNNSDAYIGSPISVDINLDYDVDYIYFGVNYYDPRGRWVGQLYRITTNQSADPSSWILTKVMDVPGPISAPPSVSVDEKGRRWVFFGTGKYFGAIDAVDSSVNYIVGVKDMDSGVKSISDLANVTNASLEVTAQGDTMVLGSNSLNFEDFEEYVDGYDGWYISLPRGERILEKGAVLGGAVFMTTYSPMAESEGNPCDAGNVAFGGGHLYVLYYKTGTAHTKHMLGVENGVALNKVATGGMPSSPEIHIDEKGEVTVSVQSATGTVEQYNVSTPFSIKSGIKLWKGGF